MCDTYDTHTHQREQKNQRNKAGIGYSVLTKSNNRWWKKSSLQLEDVEQKAFEEQMKNNISNNAKVT